MKGGAKVLVEPHRHEGIFVARGKEDALVTLNSTPGVAVYGEKRISVDGPPGADGNATKVEYRVWNPFRSKSKSHDVFLFLHQYSIFYEVVNHDHDDEIFIFLFCFYFMTDSLMTF